MRLLVLLSDSSIACCDASHGKHNVSARLHVCRHWWPFLLHMPSATIYWYTGLAWTCRRLAKDVLGVEIDGTTGPSEDDNTFQSINFSMCVARCTGCLFVIHLTARRAFACSCDRALHASGGLVQQL